MEQNGWVGGARLGPEMMEFILQWGAAIFRTVIIHMQVIFDWFPAQNTQVQPGNFDTVELVDKTHCYGLKNNKAANNQVPGSGYSFTFGGPGGKCD